MVLGGGCVVTKVEKKKKNFNIIHKYILLTPPDIHASLTCTRKVIIWFRILSHRVGITVLFRYIIKSALREIQAWVYSEKQTKQNQTIYTLHILFTMIKYKNVDI